MYCQSETKAKINQWIMIFEKGIREEKQERMYHFHW